LLQLFGIAFAASEQATGGQTSSPWSQYGFLVLMVVTIGIFYFLLIRPQKKKEKDRLGMISSLKKGDRVLTASGIYGVVDSFKDGDIVIVKISNNTKVEFSKNAIQMKVQ
jgi:preprotein translocase subunit YajC